MTAGQTTHTTCQQEATALGCGCRGALFHYQLKGTYKVRGEPPVKVALSQDSSLPGSTSEANLEKAGKRQALPPFLLLAPELGRVRAQGHASSPSTQLQQRGQLYPQGSYKSSTYHDLCTLLGQVRDGGRGEVEVPSFERP